MEHNDKRKNYSQLSVVQLKQHV